ncbi:MAG TPA: 1-(5-phosphoribosyl)-5-[(5-phosphoribosylamino)methylideneamino]imidazole-4-carboxamide isomerase [Tepidisphaeraceae bacterium]|jgi:phosphoribosylformimino-5-aminoimidazole carboxamide ribotide isomerase
MQIIPSIDLRHGQVVRLQQGDYGRQTDYAVDPVAVAESFARAGAAWMHIVDLDGAKEGRCVQADLIGQVAAAAARAGLAVQVGGGVRGTADIDRLIAAGAARVVVGTAAIENWNWFKDLACQSEYTGRLTLALDAKEGMVATRGWTETSGRAAVDIAREVSDWPLAAILYTDVARDGMMTGPNTDATRALAGAGHVPVIASGGVGTLDHVLALKDEPFFGVIVGRALYEGTVDLAQAVRLLQR